MKTFKQFIDEAGDYWHPDPEKDRRMSGVGNKQRSREDAPTKNNPKSKTVKVDSNKLKPGESYMDFSKRRSQSTSPTKKPRIIDRIKIKLGKVIDRVGGIG